MASSSASATWWVVVPCKGAPLGKSRLTEDPPARATLSRALAMDTLEAVAETLPPGRGVVVTSDPEVGRFAAAQGLTVLPDPRAGLNEAIRFADSTIRATAAPSPARVAVLLGDLPAVRPDDLRQAFDAAAGLERAFVPDREGTGTVLLTDRRGPAAPQFGAGSAGRHERAGYRRLDLDLPRLRTDVDVTADLQAAAALGCGRHTTEALRLLCATGSTR